MPPKPSTWNYQELIVKMGDGSMKLPKFQREFVWTIEKSAKLLDSIARGYPIGTFTIWETQERLSHIKNLGGADIPDTKEGHPVSYILDGQQRLASIFVTINGHKIGNTDYKKIYLNQENEDGEVVTLDKNDTSVSIFDLLNNDQILMDEQYPKDVRSRFQKYRDAFKMYAFSTIELTGYTTDQVIDIFTRINTLGKPLSLFEVMAAKTHDERNDFFLATKYQELQEDLASAKYEIPDSVLLQSVAVNMVNNCTRKKILKLDKEGFISEYDNTIKSIKKAIDFFRSKYNIQASRILPYDSLIVPFQYFFRKNPGGEDPNTEQNNLLEEYFWRASLSSRFSSAVESKLEQDCKRIDIIINAKNKSKLNDTADDKKNLELNDIEVNIDPAAIKNHRFTTGDAISKSVLCMLASFEPRSLKSNSKIILDNSNLSRSNSKNYHHFFPKAYLRNNNAGEANIISNITIIGAEENLKIGSNPPSKYLSGIKEDNANIQDTLRSHLIDDIDSFGLRNDCYEVFLEQRSKRICQELLKRARVEI